MRVFAFSELARIRGALLHFFLERAAGEAAVSSVADRWVACVGQAVPARLWAPASCRRLPAAAALAPRRLFAHLPPPQHGDARPRAPARMRCRAYALGHAQAHTSAYGDGHASAGVYGQAEVPEHGHGQKPSVTVRSQAGSAERYLSEVCGVPESAVDDVIMRAVTWRVTAAGRSLIDRRRRSKVERNMPIVAAYLTDVCGVLPGKAFTHNCLRLHLRLSVVLLSFACRQASRLTASAYTILPSKYPNMAFACICQPTLGNHSVVMVQWPLVRATRNHFSLCRQNDDVFLRPPSQVLRASARCFRCLPASCAASPPSMTDGSAASLSSQRTSTDMVMQMSLRSAAS